MSSENGDSELERSTEADSDNVQSDDSDGPVDVSWKDSKAVFHQDEKNRNDAVSFAKSVDKAKRRKKNDMFVSQKEAKRKLTKLPADIVQAVAKKPKQVEVSKIKKENKKLERRKARKKSSEEIKTKEYCHVVLLEEEVNRAKKVQESAAEFLKNHLYGNRVQRTPGSNQLTMQCKSSGAIKPAVKFRV